MAARLSDGFRLTWLNAPSGKGEDRLPVRAAEHNAILSRGEGTEEFSQPGTLTATLLDNRAAPVWPRRSRPGSSAAGTEGPLIATRQCPHGTMPGCRPR